MGYIYDLHVHSCECSKCASMTAREAVRAYKERGFAGIVLTNHFIRGNNRVPAGLPWAERMDYYRKAFLSAQDEGERLGMDVFFGIEEHYGNGQEILIYGISPDFTAENPDMCDIPPEELCARVRAAGGFTSHAHPYRVRDYITYPFCRMDVSALDGAEVLNAANTAGEDESALRFCRENGLMPTAGSDTHHVNRVLEGCLCGMEFPHRVHSGAELSQLLFSGAGTPVCIGTRVE